METWLRSTEPTDSRKPTDDRDRAPNLSEVEDVFRQNYARVQYSLVDFLADHLADASRAFGGDMKMVVLLAVLGQMHLGVARAAEAQVHGDGLPPGRRGMTTHRLADITGIPRETARRKLTLMEKNGWLVHDGTLWMLAMNGAEAAARADLADLDARGIRRAARLFSTLAPLVPGRRG